MRTQKTFEHLALPHLDAAHNLAFWLVRSRSDAEDIVQDAYIRAYRGFSGFRGDDIKPWLLAIVRNVAYRWLASRRRAANVISMEDAFGTRGDDAENHHAPAGEDLSAEALLIGAQERARLHAALATLAPSFREVVVLREIEDMSYAQIADVVGVPIGTVMSRLSRGRADLRAQLCAMIERDDKDAM